ncbi:hypothetical protein YSY22_41140 [Brevibacillus formosus]
MMRFVFDFDKTNPPPTMTVTSIRFAGSRKNSQYEQYHYVESIAKIYLLCAFSVRKRECKQSKGAGEDFVYPKKPAFSLN